MKYLFIGGLGDGLRNDAQDSQVLIPFSQEDGKVVVEEYVRERIAGSTQAYAVYRHVGLSPDEMIRKLIEHYGCDNNVNEGH